MTLPANVRVNTAAPFPALVQGGNFITVAKKNGIWTVSANYLKLGKIVQLPDPTIKDIVIYDETTGQYNTISVATLASSVINSYRIVTIAGDVQVAPGDVTILMNKLVGAATNIDLPTSASRNGLALTVKDYKGDANANNITFVPSGAETIDGFSGAAAAANGVALIDINYGKKTLYPLAAGGWYV